MWSRPGLCGTRRCPSETNWSIGQALPFGPDQGEIGAVCVFNPEFGAVAVAEIELAEVAVQPHFAHVLVDGKRSSDALV